MAEIQKLNGGRPLFETAFDFVHFHVYKNLEGQQALDLSEGHYFEANDMTTYTTFMVDVTSTNLELHIDYNPNEICPRQIEQISNYYIRTLEAMSGEPAARYETFCPLADADKKQLLVEWNDTADQVSGMTIHELIEARAKESPEAVAIVFNEEELTYRELNERANRLAVYLKGLEVGPGVPVGICVDRSAEMVIGLLGILKAGGAYLPMDPAYTKERLAYMLEDAKVPVVLTDSGSSALLPARDIQFVDVHKIAE